MSGARKRAELKIRYYKPKRNAPTSEGGRYEPRRKTSFSVTMA
jgi:hypothetical protein